MDIVLPATFVADLMTEAGAIVAALLPIAVPFIAVTLGLRVYKGARR